MTEAEAELIKLIKARDFTGLEYLIDLFGSEILRTIQGILNHPSEKAQLKDVQNKTFYRLWQQLPAYDREKSSLKTYITVITRNLALDEKRRIIRELKIVPMADLSQLETKAENYFEKENFLELLKSLAADDQLIFLKFYYYQETALEIAADLNLTPEVIYNRLSRGRKKIAATLTNERGF